MQQDPFEHMTHDDFVEALKPENWKITQKQGKIAMKVTYHIPTTQQEQDELKATVKRLFPASEPEIKQRATDTLNINWQDLDSLADLLDAKIDYSPFVSFTIDEPETYTDEQVALFDRPGIEVHREIDPQSFLQGF